MHGMRRGKGQTGVVNDWIDKRENCKARFQFSIFHLCTQMLTRAMRELKMLSAFQPTYIRVLDVCPRPGRWRRFRTVRVLPSFNRLFPMGLILERLDALEAGRTVTTPFCGVVVLVPGACLDARTDACCPKACPGAES
jgi:hypothetical protein